MTTIYLVRHCEAAGNIGRVFQGHIDEDISENGRRQLEKLARRFRDIPLEAVISSPLLRARRTAEAVNRYHGVPVEIDERLMEINGGCWEGKRWADLPGLYPKECHDWVHTPWAFHPAEGEAMADVYARMAAALTAIAAAHPGRQVAVVSHGCAIRNALCWAKGWPVERLNDEPWCDNTAVSVLEIGGQGIRLVKENDNSHLDKDLSTFEKQDWWKGGASDPFH